MDKNFKRPPYLGYGALLHAWRNEIKFTLDMVQKDTGIPKNRLVSLEKGLEKPHWEELEKLAKEFRVSVRDLLPFNDDRTDGIIMLRDNEARKFEQVRGGNLQYTYTCRVMSSSIPNFKPVELLLHLSNKDKVVMNRGHFFHQFIRKFTCFVQFLGQWFNFVLGKFPNHIPKHFVLFRKI